MPPNEASSEPPSRGEAAEATSGASASSDGGSLDDLLHALARPRAGAVPALGAGTWLGKFEIVKRLGAGGMGTVYHATDALLGREVALKVLGREGGKVALVPLAREARGAAALRHPGIVTIYEAARVNGLAVIVMELVRGSTLRSLLKERDLPLRAVRRIFDGIVDAVAHAHATGVVHRDLKPENIMLDDQTGDARIVDFGLARLVDALSIQQGLNLRSEPVEIGSIVGTPGYRAPEQERGGPVDPRADVFALGVVLAELLDASPARFGERAVRRRLGEVARRCRSLPAGERFADGATLRAELNRIRRLERWRLGVVVALVALVLMGGASFAIGTQQAKSVRPFRVVSRSAAGCAHDGGVTLRLSSPDAGPSMVRLVVTREDGLGWADTGTLALFAGPGPVCGKLPSNVVKLRLEPTLGARAQVLELARNDEDTWTVGEEKKFWVGIEGPTGEVTRGTQTLLLRRER